jgi:hypothetical protein
MTTFLPTSLHFHGSERQGLRPPLAGLSACCLATAALLAGCAARDANPVQVSQPRDVALSCEAIDLEIRTADEMAARVAAESDADFGRNVVIGTLGVLFFPPALFALDLGPAEELELEALRQRNDHLEELRSSQGCGGAALGGATAARAD